MDALVYLMDLVDINITVDVDSVLPSNGTNELLFDLVKFSYIGGVESL